MIQRGTTYQDLGQDYLDRLDRERTAKRLVKCLQLLGFHVVVKDPIAIIASGGDSPTWFTPMSELLY